MKTLDLIGYRREDLSKKFTNKLRKEAQVPCVLYGGKENVHFYTPMILFRDLVYTPEVAYVNMDVEGTVYKCILQEVQFHPVSEILLHADFLLLQDDVEIKMEIPVKFTGSAPGIVQGGKLVPKMRKLKVKALPKNMPEVIELNISGLDLGQSVRVRDAQVGEFTILTNPLVTVGSIAIPRSLRSAQTAAQEDE